MNTKIGFIIPVKGQLYHVNCENEPVVMNCESHEFVLIVPPSEIYWAYPIQTRDALHLTEKYTFGKLHVYSWKLTTIKNVYK